MTNLRAPFLPNPLSASLQAPLVLVPPLLLELQPHSDILETLETMGSSHKVARCSKRASWSSNCFADKGEPQGVSEGGAPPIPTLDPAYLPP